MAVATYTLNNCLQNIVNYKLVEVDISRIRNDLFETLNYRAYQ